MVVPAPDGADRRDRMERPRLRRHGLRHSVAARGAAAGGDARAARDGDRRRRAGPLQRDGGRPRHDPSPASPRLDRKPARVRRATRPRARAAPT